MTTMIAKFLLKCVTFSFLIVSILSRNVVDEDSICILSSGSRLEGAGDCTEGEVHLLGDFIKLGIHNAASFGTQARLETSYYNGRLGFIADFDKNGFESFYVAASPTNASYYYFDSATLYPGFSGDFFVPGSPIEGISALLIT